VVCKADALGGTGGTDAAPIAYMLRGACVCTGAPAGALLLRSEPYSNTSAIGYFAFLNFVALS
jgi:hypothetical protein